MPEPFTVYGRDGCEDTQRALEFFDYRGIPYEFVNINHDPDAEQFVLLQNSGRRVTPTITMGPPENQIILSEPSNEELGAALDQLGYRDPRPPNDPQTLDEKTSRF